MTTEIAVEFYDPFHPYYDQFSIYAGDLQIPSHFSVYLPDNQTDYQCLMVIAADKSKGASRWTLNHSDFGSYQADTWITIGIYRDEGRAAAQRPPTLGVSWVMNGTTITVTDPNHKLRVGDSISTQNMNTPVLVGATVMRVDATTFDFTTQLGGPTSGTNGSYQQNFKTDFYSNYVVFRLLPSFKLVPYSFIQQIFSSSTPSQVPAVKTIYNITTGQTISIPGLVNNDTNYEPPYRSLPTTDFLTLLRRFDQQYDESGNPLPLKYLANGQPSPVVNVDSPYSNSQIFYNAPVNPAGDSRLYVYDYYGIDLNDPTRIPFLSNTIVTRDTTVTGNFNNFKIFQAIESNYAFQLDIPYVAVPVVNSPIVGPIDGVNVNFDFADPNGKDVDELSGAPLVYKTDWQGTQLQYSTPRTNYADGSQVIGDSYWTLTNLTATLSSGLAPDYTYGATIVNDGSAINYHYVSQHLTNLTAAAPYTLSFHLKQGLGLRYVSVIMDDGNGLGMWATFDLSAGTVTNTGNNGTATISGAHVTSLNSGWYRCSISGVFSTTATGARIAVAGTTSPNYASFQVYQGTNNTFFVWGAQLEAGNVLTSYIVTPTNADVAFTDYTFLNGTEIAFAAPPLPNSGLYWSGTYLKSGAPTPVTPLAPVYSGTLNDFFGNLAIGAQANNALVVRKQVLPLQLDSFNRPVKNPSA